MADLMKNEEKVNNDLTGGKQGGRIAVNEDDFMEFLDSVSVILLDYANHLKEKGELK